LRVSTKSQVLGNYGRITSQARFQGAAGYTSIQQLFQYIHTVFRFPNAFDSHSVCL
jgi:hypothetical protein